MRQWILAMVFVCGTITTSSGLAADLKTGYVLVANQQSGSASLIDLSTNTARVIAVGTGPHEAVISPSGRTGIVTIYGTSQPGNQLAVIDIKTAAVSKTITLGQYTRPHGAMFMPGDENRVVVTSEATQNILVVNLAESRIEHVISTGATGSHMVAITADGKRAFTSDIGAGAVSEMNLESHAFGRVIPVAPRVEGVAVTPDGSAVWAGSNTDGTVSIVDTKTGTIVKKLSGFSLPYRLAMSRDGKTAIICDPQGDKIHVADVAKREVIWTLDQLGSPRGVNIAPDGKTAFVTLAADETMGVIDLEARKLLRKVKVEQSPDGVWYGPTGK